MESAVLPRAHLRAALLLVLAEAPAHGYDLVGLLVPLGMGDVDRASVYRTLRAMEAEGLVASGWDPSPSGPARRTYRVTPAGKEWAASAAGVLREADGHMGRWLDRYRAVVRHGGAHRVQGVSAAS